MGKINNKIIKTDILIAGGGPAGCSLAIILAKAGIDVVCVDQDDPVTSLTNEFDGRTTAISFGSHVLMKDIGVWDSLVTDACPIKDIHILESGSPILLQFLAKDTTEEAFGWIVENKKLRRALYERLSNFTNAHHLAPAKITNYAYGSDYIETHLENGTTVQSKLVVGADGRQSFTRQWMGIDTRGWDYQQTAIVCIVNHENPHNNCAIEDFRASGPFAILPMMDTKDSTHQSSIVWTQDKSVRDSALQWDENTFNAGLNERFPKQYGAVKWNGLRFSYPLNLIHAQNYIANRMILVADAAHGIHPIAGQGLNIGLRDVDALSTLLITAKSEKKDFGHFDVIKRYEELRRPDNILMAAATDTLNKLFSNNSSSFRILRKSGLKFIQKWSGAKSFFMAQAMGKSVFKNKI